MTDKLYKIAAIRSSYIKKHYRYRMMIWDKFDYSILTRNIMYYKKKGKYQKGTWNDVIIAADTETSKSHEISKDPLPNHVCAWTISIRAYNTNIVTLYGNKPSEMMQCLDLIKQALSGDEMYVFFHNLAYDYTFLRLFLFKQFGTPKKELNTKPHYPIMIGFENGIVLKDSLILSQCKLEKWAKDLNVHHQKAVGSWDYDLIRDQDHKFTRAELKYIENDTLALVECLDAFCTSLHKNINTIVYTATGIVREEVRERAKNHNGHRDFERQALSFDQLIKFMKLYHGGYSHANRFYISDILADTITKCRDFASSYPFCLLAYKYPCSKFVPMDKTIDPEYILRNNDRYAFIFKISFVNIRLKDRYFPMPALQASKCEQTINMRIDNGRILQAGFVNLFICDIDLEVLADQYIWDECKCTEVEYAKKDYLPRWFTDYVYELFSAKCERKVTKDEDPVNYALSKMRVNSVYGLTVQKPVRENFIEVTEAGEYKINKEGDTAFYQSGEYRQDFDQDMQKEYEKFLKNPNTVLSYTIGTYCTAYAFRNLFELGKCVNCYYNDEGKLAYPPHWYYSDTDSCYSDDWNEDKIAEYNEHCKELLRANGYGAVKVGNKEYWLGVAEPDSEYEEFVVLGSKRYAGRGADDHELHITVAGVPKKTGAKCLKDDLTNFCRGFIFDGETTGKLTHFYIFSDKGIYKDEFGNEIGDSIDLQPCDYELDAVEKFEYTMSDDYYFEYYGEENFDIYDR